jgi:ornithine cyclodeaminase/alanine dehydrogenase-like protein (mu-crystallin family)
MPGEPLRYLSRADVEAVGLEGTQVVEILERAFRAKREGDVEMPPKIGVHPRDDAFIHAMPAYLSDVDAVGLKWVAGYPGNQELALPYIHGLFVLSDAGTGRPLAVMDATWITEIRTAAASMLGIRALAERPVEALGILGCGRQGRVHLDLARDMFPALARLTLFDRHPERAEELAAAHARPAEAARAPEERSAGTRAALDVRVVASAQEIAAGADVIITTAAIVRDPERPLRREHLDGATVACAIDFDASLSEDLFAGAAAFVVDDVAQYGYYREQGYFAGYPADPVELSTAIAEGASRPPGLRVFVPLGLALEDVAVVAEINRRAAEGGLGRELPM